VGEHKDQPFTKEEVLRAINSVKNKKVAGPDKIYNKHLRVRAEDLVGTWILLYNKCLEHAKIHNAWHCSTVTVLYKDKGKRDDPDAYRGIVLECTPFKALSKLILNRISGRTCSEILNEQYGFMLGKSTLQAAAQLLAKVRNSLKRPTGCIYGLIGYTSVLQSGQVKTDAKTGINTRQTRLCSSSH
jgi:hypothetical protein